MHRKSVSPKNIESPFNPDEMFFSITDLKGIILSGNDVFVRVSKYSRDELVGSPHN
ncbi:MAG: chemotaxis protein, partial [Aquificae bacterium]|nr:chemotaxis protein [Aquificota bacterium]